MIRFFPVVLLLAATPALAFDTTQLGQGGSLTLDDIIPLINKSAPLKREVTQALAAAHKKASDIICDGQRFPSQWKNLGGERVAPYSCDFGGKWLLIETTVRISGRSRQVYDSITPAAMANATKVSETNPTWKWTTEDPNADDPGAEKKK